MEYDDARPIRLGRRRIRRYSDGDERRRVVHMHGLKEESEDIRPGERASFARSGLVKAGFASGNRNEITVSSGMIWRALLAPSVDEPRGWSCQVGSQL